MVELDHEEPIILVRQLRVNLVVFLDLLPVFDLLQFFIGFERSVVLLPLLPGVDNLDLVLVEGRDDDVEALHFAGERTEADRVEVKGLLPHIFEHSIEGEMVVLSKTQFEKVLLSFLLLAKFRLELFKKTDEELDIALLTVDS